MHMYLSYNFIVDTRYHVQDQRNYLKSIHLFLEQIYLFYLWAFELGCNLLLRLPSVCYQLHILSQLDFAQLSDFLLLQASAGSACLLLSSAVETALLLAGWHGAEIKVAFFCWFSLRLRKALCPASQGYNFLSDPVPSQCWVSCFFLHQSLPFPFPCVLEAARFATCQSWSFCPLEVKGPDMPPIFYSTACTSSLDLCSQTLSSFLPALLLVFLLEYLQRLEKSQGASTTCLCVLKGVQTFHSRTYSYLKSFADSLPLPFLF